MRMRGVDKTLILLFMVLRAWNLRRCYPSSFTYVSKERIMDTLKTAKAIVTAIGYFLSGVLILVQSFYA